MANACRHRRIALQPSLDGLDPAGTVRTGFADMRGARRATTEAEPSGRLDRMRDPDLAGAMKPFELDALLFDQTLAHARRKRNLPFEIHTAPGDLEWAVPNRQLPRRIEAAMERFAHPIPGLSST